METAFFLVIAAVAVFAGGMVILAKNAVHSALFLVVNLFCVALLYLSLSAEFLAAVQLMVYAGAIVVLFLFVITLLNPRAEEGADHLHGQAVAAVGLGALLLVEVGLTITTGVFRLPVAGYPPPAPSWGDNIRAIGQMMFTDYLLPFEVTSVLLLIALLGATVLAKGRFRGEKAER